MSAGRVVFIAGGTGVFPFCDTIDLLFKELLISKNNQHSREIIAKNPILATKTLSKKFQFTLLLSMQSPDDIHEMTLFELN
jgi:hypothetical protein